MLICPDDENTIRCKDGERFELEGEGSRPAIIAEDCTHAFHELDDRASQAARHLPGQGLTAGDRIPLLFDKSRYPYVGLSAVMKFGAAYVPLDASLPAERIGFNSEGAVVETVREIEYADAAQRETARREALTPLSRPG